MTGEPAPEQVAPERIIRDALNLAASLPLSVPAAHLDALKRLDDLTITGTARDALDALVAQRDEWKRKHDFAIATLTEVGNLHNALQERVAGLERERDEARETAKNRLDLGYRIKDDLLDERNRVAALEQALREIMDHPLVANRGDENCDWHCVAEIQNLAYKALAAAGEPEAATPWIESVQGRHP